MLVRQFFAALTILSFTLTQVLPAWALRPGIEGTSQAGLEEALQGGPAAAAAGLEEAGVAELGGSEDIAALLRPFLKPQAPRPVAERIAALAQGYGPYDAPGAERSLPAAATDLTRRLALSVADGVLTLDEAADPMLALALLAPGDRRLREKAARAVEARSRLCSNCAEHALHEMVSAEELTVVEHGVLDLLSGVAAALDLIALNGELRTVDVGGVDHGTEIARTAQTVAWLHEVVGGASAAAGRVDLTRENLALLAGLDAPVVALVSHTRTPGWNADHYVSILQVDPEADAVVYLDNGERKTVSLDDFIRLHRPQDGRAVLFLDAARAQGLRDSGLTWTTLGSAESARLAGACGIILHVGRYSQEGGLASAFDAAYRGKDNTGEIVVEPNGLRRVTVQGSPSALVKSFQLLGQGYPEEAMVWYLEANPGEKIPEDLQAALVVLRAGGVLTERQRYLIHRKWRSLTKRETTLIQDFIGKKSRQILQEQGLGWVKPDRLDVIDSVTGQRRPAVKDDLYRLFFYTAQDEEVKTGKKKIGDVRMDNAVGRGKRGWYWSGRWLPLRKVAAGADWPVWRQALLETGTQFGELYRYDLTTIREILRYELADNLERWVAAGQILQADAARMESVFVRNFEQVWAGQELKPEEQDVWKGAWTALTSEQARIAGHVSPDPVRHCFRVQGSLVAAILRNPTWGDQVQQLIDRDMPAARKGRSWYDDWRVESHTGTPGLAFMAVTQWFQEKFMPPEQRAKVELNYMDSLTLSYMHIVDRKLRHDRWATTGSRIPKDAQPVTDTGLLSNVSGAALREIMAIARRRYEREVLRAKGPGLEDRNAILRHQFFLVLQAYLREHPEMRGTPARGFAHNGDLSPVVQNGILPMLRANGYINQQTRVDAESGETKREMILTDTWKLGALVEFVYDAWRKDRALGGVLDAEGMRYLGTAQVCFMPPEYRTLWNEMQTTLQSQNMAFTPEELAHRVALMEFGRGVRVTPGKASSEIALGWLSLYDPALDGVVSHRRAVELVVVRGADGDFQVQYTSDALTALRMFTPEEVETAIQKDTQISAEYQKGIHALVERRRAGELDDAKFEQEMRLLVARSRAAEKQAAAFKAELSLTLKGEQKYVKVRKVWNSAAGRFEAEIDITNFKGQRLATIRPGQADDIIEAERDNIKVHRDRSITIAAASKGGFPTFGMKEINSELGATALMHVSAGVRREDPASLDITREGLQKTARALADLVTQQEAGLEEAEGGLNRETLVQFLSRALETGTGTNVLTGVGSSENDSSGARAAFRFLLPMLGYDNVTPARLISIAAHYDRESTLAGGISWSGTTALTLLALQWLKSQGVAVSGVTGNPTVKDLADIVGDSAGTVHARTKKEVAIYTTVGFLMLLEGLFEEAIQQNLIAQEVAQDDAVRDDLKRRLDEVWGDYSSMVENLAVVLGDPERDYFREESPMARASRHFSKFLGMRFIGDYYNNPIVDEIGIKVGETRNINFTSYDYRSYGYRGAAAKEGNTGWFLNATSMNRIREATEVLRAARENSRSVIVQTFDPGTVKFTEAEREQGHEQAWEEFQRELARLEQDFNGEGENPLAIRFTVPRIHFTLQPMLDVITGQIFGVGLALAAGYSNEATDGPRNLAKSVTVLGVQLAFGALITLDKFFDMDEQEPGSRAREMEAYQAALEARWGDLPSAWQQGLHRLPLRTAELIQRLRLDDDFRMDEVAMKNSFGPTLENLRRIVILFDTDEAAEVAARMAGIPLANKETVLSDSQDDKLFAKSKDESGKYLPREIRRAINGRETTIRFVRSQADSQAENRISIQFDGEGGPAIEFSGDERGILKAVQSQTGVGYSAAAGTLTLAGRQYVLQVLGKRGISLAAVQPDLLGVPVEVHRPTDFTLDQDTDSGTLVVAMSRSNHKGANDGEVTGIASAVSGRDGSQKDQTSAEGVSEGTISATLEDLRERGVPVFTIGDPGSDIQVLASHGSAALEGTDLDSMSAVTQYYTALLLLGSRMGAMRGVPGAPDYERSLEVVPNVLARTLASLYTEEAETGTRFFWPDVVGVTLNIGHAPVTCAYAPDAAVAGRGVASGTVRLTRGSGTEKEEVLTLSVEVSNGQVTGILDPQPQYEIAGRPYRVTFDKARGMVFRGVEPDYAGGGTLRDALVSLRQNRFGPEENRGKQIRSWGVIGGVQDRSGAMAVAFALERAGYQARHLEVDESVHGWYALMNDAVEKYPDLFFREGVSPDYDPDNMEDGQQEGKDVGIIILATDTRTFGASIVDAQRARTRNARFILVVKESDRNSEEVVNAGAHAIITVPDAFNEMTSFSHELIGEALARELQLSEGPEHRYEAGSARAALALLPSVEMRDVSVGDQAGLSPIAQDRIESDLEGRNRSPEQVDLFVGLIAELRAGEQPLVVRTSQEGPYHCVYAVFPYRDLGPAVGNPAVGIPASLGVPVHDPFVTTVTEAEGSQPIAVVRLEINRAEDAATAEQGIAEAVAPYNATHEAAVPAAPADFGALIEHGLQSMSLPVTGAIRDAINRAISDFKSNRDPQVRVVGIPSEQEIGTDVHGQSVMIVVAQNRPGLAVDVETPIRNADADIENSAIVLSDPGIGEIGLNILHVRNRGVTQLRHAAAKIERILSLGGAPVPESFSQALAPYAEQMPNVPLASVYAGYLGVRDGEISSFPVLSDDVPERDGQSALGILLPDTEANAAADAEIRRIIGENGLEAVMGLDIVYTEEGESPVRIVRVVVNARYDDERVEAACDQIEQSFGGEAAPQAPPTQAGLEEAVASPLALPLPEPWPTPAQVLARIRAAVSESPVLARVRSLLQGREGIPDGYRRLSSAERGLLAQNRVTAVSWDYVHVPEQFGAEDIANIFNVRLYGTVRMGLQRGVVAFGPTGSPVNARIENSDLRDVDIGDNVLVRDNGSIERQVIESGAIVTFNRSVTAVKGTTFGLGAAIPVGPEVGGREVKAYPEILLGDVARLALSRTEQDQEFQQDYAREHTRYTQAAKADYGYIGAGAQVSGNGTVANLFAMPGVQVVDTPMVENTMVLSDEGKDPARIAGAAEVKNLLAQQGVDVGSGATVIGTSDENGVLFLEHSHAHGALVQDSVIAPNSGAGHGRAEVTASLMGPFVGMHHSSLLIAAVWPEGMGNIGAEAAIGSNHTSRAPDQEFKTPGEGFFGGLNSSYSYSGNYEDGVYSIWGKGVSALPQRMGMPFSLIEKPVMQIPGMSPEFMQIAPAWIWSDNAYMPMRNEGKYASRDKSKRHKLGMNDLQRYPFEILRPSIVNKMIRARDALAFVDTARAHEGVIPQANGNPPTIVKFYTEKEIPGLGKNFMLDSAREKAVNTYSNMIRYYALKGLLAEVKQRITDGRAGEIPALLDTPSDNLRWEHERRVLRTEMPGGSVVDGLQQLADLQDGLAVNVRTAKEKDDERGERILDDYGDTHTPAANDKFVKQSAADAQALRAEIDALVPQLTGLEEGNVVGYQDAIARATWFVTGELAAGRTGVEVVAERVARPGEESGPPMRASGADLLNGRRIEDLVNFAAQSQGQVLYSLGGARGNVITLRTVAQAAGLEEAVDPAALKAERLPRASAALDQEPRAIIAGPHVSGVALGLALNKAQITGADGTKQQAAQVVFVVENADEERLLREMTVPIAIFSAADYNGDYAAAVEAAKRMFSEGTAVTELGTDNQPVPQTIQLLLQSLFGIEINLDAELAAWNSFIDRATLAIQA